VTVLPDQGVTGPATLTCTGYDFADIDYLIGTVGTPDGDNVSFQLVTDTCQVEHACSGGLGSGPWTITPGGAITGSCTDAANCTDDGTSIFTIAADTAADGGYTNYGEVDYATITEVESPDSSCEGTTACGVALGLFTAAPTPDEWSYWWESVSGGSMLLVASWSAVLVVRVVRRSIG
jgi:hypothetical protein